MQTAEILAAYRQDVAPGLALADTEAMARIRKNWAAHDRAGERSRLYRARR